MQASGLCDIVIKRLKYNDEKKTLVSNILRLTAKK